VSVHLSQTSPRGKRNERHSLEATIHRNVVKNEKFRKEKEKKKKEDDDVTGLNSPFHPHDLNFEAVVAAAAAAAAEIVESQQQGQTIEITRNCWLVDRSLRRRRRRKRQGTGGRTNG